MNTTTTLSSSQPGDTDMVFMVMVRSSKWTQSCAFEGTEEQCRDWVRLCRPMQYRIVSRRK